MLLKLMFGPVLELTDTGWRILTWRWMGFFLVLAVLNEVAWRSFDTDTWVQFKVFGIMPLTLLFSATQLPTILRHQIPPADGSTPDSEGQR